ncbi:MAG: chromosomal replication initiator protein DnaA [Desulfuromonadaceae bacterium]|nr:chromosomal replication initiator protein DnaA [Desulfuromonas sp.]MDY0184921.1 chromosomal replication initiator protein DnaA [Desulfuromonadaceae bacterium]
MNKKPQDTSIWNEIKAALEKDISAQNFKTWIQPLTCTGATTGHIKIEAGNRFVKKWLESNYLVKLQSIAEEISGVPTSVEIYIAEVSAVIPKKAPVSKSKLKNDIVESKPARSRQISNINTEYCFENFISGNSNQFAAAAAIAVANNPATIYNPLFIYGGVGLGKTHLLNAIGNKIKADDADSAVCYYSSEKFTNELINAIRYGKMEEFRNKFRSIDVLLIDDVQFIAGKERTQEEFFHTFNSLYDSHKQIVVTSDKFPKEIPGLEERLRSRFEWGLIADIQAPDKETKQAILEAKAEKNNIVLPEDVAEFLSGSVISNIRELEGYLVRIGAYASLTSTPISIEMAKEVLKDIIVEYSQEITVEDIQKKVTNYFNIKISDIKSAKRTKKFVYPRQIAMYLCRQLTSCSYPEIGEYFGGKDHSTVIHAIKKIDAELLTNTSLKQSLKNIKNTLLPS